jgi:hypothetical protein
MQRTMTPKVYTALGLHEDKNPMSYMHRCIMIRWVETLSTPPFISQRGRVYKEDLGRLISFLTGTLSLLT